MNRTLLLVSLLSLLTACDKGSDAASADAKPSDAKTDDAKADDAKSDDAKSDDTKTADAADAEAGDGQKVDTSPAKADDDAWMEFESTEDQFTVKFPAAPTKESTPIPTLGGSVPSTAYMATKGETQFVGVTVLSVPEDIMPKFDVERGLNGARDGMLNNVGGTIVSEKHIKYAGQDARAVVGKVTVEGIAMRIEARIFWVTPRMYSLIAVAPESTPVEMATKFFDSFSLQTGT